ncbi:MAG: hypothetical protein M0P42_15020 [Gallionella sp.]|jgi:hypothetical protein|nr:hypothetical protein [Gallionella sp.]
MTQSVTIDFNANLARFTSGLDKVTNDLNRFQSNAARVSGNITKAFNTLGVGLSVVGFGAMVKGSIDALDRVNDLRLATGLTSETLAGLKFAAELAGGDLDSIAKSINKLAVNMGKDEEKFKRLGITAKDPLEAFKQLADVFSEVQDPQLRAALGAEALGKAWEGAAPLMMEGSKGVGELVEKGRRLSGITDASTKAADAFNDKWKELFGTGKLLNTMVGDALPLFNALADDMLAARKQTDALETEFKPLLETGKAVAVLFGNVAFVFKAVGTEIGGIAAQAAALGRGNLTGAIAIGDAMKNDAAAARRNFDEWERRILTLDGKGAGAANETVKKIRNLALEARVGGVVGGKPGKTASQQRGGVDDYASRINQAVAGAINSSDLVKAQDFAATIERLDALFFDSGLDVDVYVSALDNLAHMTVGVTQESKEAVKAMDEMSEFAREAARNMQDAMADGFFDIMQGKFDTLGSSFKATIDRMVANAMAAKLGNYLLGDFGKTGEMGGWAGQGLAAITDMVIPKFSFASGTPYVPHDMTARIHKGERIIPAAENRGGGGGMTVVNQFTISGPADRRTQEQLAAAAGMGIQRAMARNN